MCSLQVKEQCWRLLLGILPNTDSVQHIVVQGPAHLDLKVCSHGALIWEKARPTVEQMEDCGGDLAKQPMMLNHQNS